MMRVLKEAALSHFRQRFSHLVLHVTGICNFRCQHCFVDFENSPKDLTLAEIGAIAKTFPRLIWLDIGGGEPFLRKDLAEIIALFEVEEISIPTNGWFTEKTLSSVSRVLSKTPIKKLLLSISLDGREAVHDEIRKQKGSFQKAIETYRALRAHFPLLRVKINTVLTERNAHEIVPLMREVKTELQPAFHSLIFLRGSPINPSYRLPTPETIMALENDVDEIQKTYLYGRSGILSRIQRNYQSIKREIANRTLQDKTQVIPCLGGQAHAVIYANGDVGPCELLPAVGNLRREDLRGILSGEEWANAVGAIRRKQCHCTHDCNMVENILFNFKTYPKLLLGEGRA